MVFYIYIEAEDDREDRKTENYYLVSECFSVHRGSICKNFHQLIKHHNINIFICT